MCIYIWGCNKTIEEENTSSFLISVYRNKHKEYEGNIKVQRYLYGFAYDLF